MAQRFGTFFLVLWLSAMLVGKNSWRSRQRNLVEALVETAPVRRAGACRGVKSGHQVAVS